MSDVVTVTVTNHAQTYVVMAMVFAAATQVILAIMRPERAYVNMWICLVITVTFAVAALVSI